MIEGLFLCTDVKVKFSKCFLNGVSLLIWKAVLSFELRLSLKL